MNRTEISWVKNQDGTQGFTSNPVRGKCLHACPYCYAETIRKRYKQPANISWHPEELDKIRNRKKPATIFMGSMHDLWGEWVPDVYKQLIIQVAELCTQHTFLFLTKNVLDYRENPTLENCWYGVTDDCHKSDTFPLDDFAEWITPSLNKFISFEPLLGPLGTTIPVDVQWIIIGCLNKNGKHVPVEQGGTRFEWVTDILSQANKLNIPVFIKPELSAMYPELPKRTEIPYLK